MARHSQQAKNAAQSKKNASGGVSKSGTRRPSAARSRAVEPEPRILDDRTRRDMVGGGFVLLGIVLFIAAVAPTGAIVTSFLSESLHLVFGVGCYLAQAILTINLPIVTPIMWMLLAVGVARARSAGD